MTAPAIGEIGLAVNDAQAVLQMVADKLGTSDGLPAEAVCTLFSAVTLAIARLNAVHDALHAAEVS